MLDNGPGQGLLIPGTLEYRGLGVPDNQRFDMTKLDKSRVWPSRTRLHEMCTVNSLSLFWKPPASQ